MFPGQRERTRPLSTAHSVLSSAEDTGCTDYYCFVNAQRHDLESHTIPINQTGFLGPQSSAHGDPSPYNGTGWAKCWERNNSCGIDCQKQHNAKTCWEQWAPSEWLSYMETQAGPGGYVHIDNEDMIGDKPGAGPQKV